MRKLVCTILLLLSILTAVSTASSAQPSSKFQYAVKFVCGADVLAAAQATVEGAGEYLAPTPCEATRIVMQHPLAQDTSQVVLGERDQKV